MMSRSLYFNELQWNLHETESSPLQKTQIRHNLITKTRKRKMVQGLEGEQKDRRGRQKGMGGDAAAGW